MQEGVDIAISWLEKKAGLLLDQRMLQEVTPGATVFFRHRNWVLATADTSFGAGLSSWYLLKNFVQSNGELARKSP